jgi:hypothetical protein
LRRRVLNLAYAKVPANPKPSLLTRFGGIFLCMDYGMEQEYVNYLLGAVCTLLGWLLHSMWEAVKDLQAADKQLTNKVAAIEVLVAGKYVTRLRLQRGHGPG